jgi:hypothetical protein
MVQLCGDLCSLFSKEDNSGMNEGTKCNPLSFTPHSLIPLTQTVSVHTEI